MIDDRVAIGVELRGALTGEFDDGIIAGIESGDDLPVADVVVGGFAILATLIQSGEGAEQ